MHAPYSSIACCHERRSHESVAHIVGHCLFLLLLHSPNLEDCLFIQTIIPHESVQELQLLFALNECFHQSVISDIDIGHSLEFDIIKFIAQMLNAGLRIDQHLIDPLQLLLVPLIFTRCPIHIFLHLIHLLTSHTFQSLISHLFYVRAELKLSVIQFQEFTLIRPFQFNQVVVGVLLSREFLDYFIHIAHSCRIFYSPHCLLIVLESILITLVNSSVNSLLRPTHH